MPNYLKPKSPLYHKESDSYFYPVTTSDQIIVENNRLSDYSMVSDTETPVVLSSSKWIYENGQYVQSVIIDNLTEDYSVNVKIAYTDDLKNDLLIKKSAGHINYAKQDNNTITFYCLKNQPDTNIPIELEVNV